MPLFTSEEIRILRTSRNMKQQEVAKKMDDISVQRYSELENHANLSESQVTRLLKAMGYTIETARKFLDGLPPPQRMIR